MSSRGTADANFADVGGVQFVTVGPTYCHVPASVRAGSSTMGNKSAYSGTGRSATIGNDNTGLGITDI